MSSLSKDMDLVLNQYCKRDSIAKINFDKKQKESEIKVHAHLINQHSTDQLPSTSKEGLPHRSQHSSQSKSLENDREYNKVGKEMSLKRQDSSRRSLSSQINKSTLNPSNEKLGQINKNKIRYKNIFKGLFSSSKSQKKNEVNFKEIDKLARFEAQSGMATSIDLEDKEPLHESRKNSSIMDFNQTVPFKSHQIGEKLTPLHTKRNGINVPNWIRAIIPENNNIKDKRLDAEISTNNENEQTDCNCNEKRINLIVDVFDLVITNISAKIKDERAINAKILEIELFDFSSYHFKNCHVGKNMKENNVSRSYDSWKQSQASLCSTATCLLFSDDPIPNISPLLEQLESEDAIDCPVEKIEYFSQATCYKYFEHGLKQTIGTHCTIKNVALLHYLTRKIVNHIGDPSDKNNKKIKKILKYSEKFLKENYYPHIKKVHKSMENFILHCHGNGEVD